MANRARKKRQSMGRKGKNWADVMRVPSRGIEVIRGPAVNGAARGAALQASPGRMAGTAVCDGPPCAPLGFPTVSARADEEIVTDEQMNSLLRGPVVRAARARAETACSNGFLDAGGLRIPTGGNPDGRDMDTMTVLLTPKRAAPLRGRYSGGRASGQNAVTRIGESILDGKFVLTHQSIAVDVHGNMYDGGHRTGAVVKVDRPVLVVVAYNCPPFAVKYTDLGRGRSPADALALSPHGFTHCTMVSRMTKEAMMGMSFAGYARIPSEMIVRVAELHHEKVKWVFRHCAPGRGMRGPMYGAIFRAVAALWNDEAKLARAAEFCGLLRASSHTGAAACPLNKLLQYMQSPKSFHNRPGYSTEGKELYLRTTVALNYFVEGRELKVWSFPKEDVWPLDVGDCESIEVDPSDEGLE